MPRPATAANLGGRKKESVYLFIRELIQEGKYAWFVTEEGRFLIKWDKAVELYMEYRATKNPKFIKNTNRRKASNALRAALLHHYEKDGAKEFAESRKLGGKTKVIERQFQMPSSVFQSLFGSSVELPDNRKHASGDQSDTSGISGSDTELMQDDQSWWQWLCENLYYDVDMTPKQSPMQGGIPFSVTFNPGLDAHITSVYAVFVKSGIVLGNVEMVILPDCLLGRKIPGASSSGWGDVIFKANHDIQLGSTRLFYYSDDREVVVMVKNPSPLETLCKDMSCHKAKSSTCSDEELQIFESFGNAHQVQVLGRLVLTTAREGTQQFIKNIFSSLAGRLVFDVYKNNSDPSGISGSDTELMQEDQSLLQWLHGNLNSDVDMVPKQRSMQGEVSFCVTFRTSQDAHGTSVYAVFVKSDIVLGTVEMVFSSICLYGHKIPGASSSDWGNVIFKVHHGIHLWSRKLFNYPDDREVAVMVKTPSLLETLCKDMSCHKANSSTCNDEELQRFESFGNAQRGQFLGLLVFAAVRVGTQQFIKNIFFSSSAGRLVFDAYKNNSATSGISGSDTELIQEDQPLLQWLHGNLNSDFNMTPKQRSMRVKVSTQGEVPFCVASSPSQDVHVTSVYAIFVKSDIVLGNVEMVFSSVYLYGCKIPGASSCGWGNVIFKAHHDIHLGSRILFYYPDDKEVVVMVKTPNLFEILCKDIRCHKANSSTCSEERQRFESFGNAQQVQFLGLLVFAAAREDAQQFIKNTFPSSAGKLVFDACKDSQPLPENYRHF